jgi:hypothetical protein
VYFDTPALLFYQQHRRDKRSRFKVRKRLYNLTNTAFLEVKEKTNQGRTIKTRASTANNIEGITIAERGELGTAFDIKNTNLSSVLTVNYNRISLADFSTNQRLTIDTNLNFISGNNSCTINNWAVVEVKPDLTDRLLPCKLSKIWVSAQTE